MDMYDAALRGIVGSADVGTTFSECTGAFRALLYPAGKHHKKITEWARQMIVLLRRWLPHRVLIIVADSSYAVLELLEAVQQQVCFITRLQLRAALYDP